MSRPVSVTTYTCDISICSMICRIAVEEHKVPNLTHKNVDIACSMENYDTRLRQDAAHDDDAVHAVRWGDHRRLEGHHVLPLREASRCGLYPADQKEAVDTFLTLFYSKFGFVAQFTFGKQKFDFVGFMSTVNLVAMDASVKEVLDAMEASLEKSAYVCGDSYTLADIAATAFLARIHIVKDETMFGPNTAKYWNEKLKTRPSFQAGYVLWKWEQSLMCKKIDVFASGGNPETVKWTTPPSVL